MKREDYTDDIDHPLSQALESCQERALTIFLERLMSAMNERQMTIEHLVNSLADYVHNNHPQPEWTEVLSRLESVAEELRRIGRI